LAKSKTSPASADDLIRGALSAALAQTEEQRLVKSGQSPGLFAVATGANKQAIDRCLVGPPPLLAEARRDGKAVFVRPTAAGLALGLSWLPQSQGTEALLRWADALPPDEVFPLALKWASGLPASDRATFLADVAPRLGGRGEELVRAVAAEEARVVAAERAAYRARYELARDHHRARRVQAEEASRWHAAAERQLDQMLRDLAAPPAPPAESTEPSPPPRPPLPPPAATDLDFRRAVVEEMVETWHVAVQRGNAEARSMLESVLRNIPGVERIGEAGKPAAFDPGVHEAAEYLETGTPATVVAPGWQVRGERGAYVVRKAVVGRK
jgi:hypothetical protein